MSEEEWDPHDFHSDEECGTSPTAVHEAIREALRQCGVPHPCCASTWAMGFHRDEDGGPVPGDSTELVIFYGHKHVRISAEQEFALVNALAEAGVKPKRLDEDL